MRKVDFTDELSVFLKNAEINVKNKIDYVLDILINQNVINSIIAKKLSNSVLYEIRVKVNNEYRILCFTIDNENITQAKHILFLNAFQKKATKDYDKEIKKHSKY